MTLSRKTVGVITVLIIAALLGLVILQVALLRYAMELKEQAFRRNVLAAMGEVSQKIAAREMVGFVFTSDDSTQTGSKVVAVRHADSTAGTEVAGEMIIITSDSACLTPLEIQNGTVRYNLPSPQRVSLKVIDPMSGEEDVLIDTFSLAGEHVLDIDDDKYGQGMFVWRFRSDSLTATVQMMNGVLYGPLPPEKRDSVRLQLAVDAVDRMVFAETRPIEERLDIPLLDSLIDESLRESGIELDYAFGVITGRDDSLRLSQYREFGRELKSSPYKTRLLLHDMLSEPAYLSLFFPRGGIFLWRQLAPVLVPTVVLMAIIIGCFYYTVRTIVRQKRFAGLIIDFINNMTHEFKTPIATIQLACEALARPDIGSDRQRILRYNDMISNENRRMRNQTDRILQMAVLEQGDYELDLDDVDMHEIIAGAIDGISLQVENRGGTVNTRFEATDHILRADAVHMTSIIGNLLDNANKYSPGKPDITVTTRNGDGGLYIAVIDKGLGIDRADRKIVFDKYFRVPSGNIHDVKGFGLGLSYVKLMVTAHGGRVWLESEVNRGTTVWLFFPQNGTTE